MRSFFHQPPGFVDSTIPIYVCHLQRSLYRLKQAPRAWFQRFASFVTHAGFQRRKTNTSFLVFHHGSSISFMLLYMDHIILKTSSEVFLLRNIIELHSEFATINFGSLNYFLGVSTQLSTSSIF